MLILKCELQTTYLQIVFQIWILTFFKLETPIINCIFVVMKLKFTKLPKHKAFDYKPRYYNEQKERLEERKRKFETMEAEGKTRTRDDIEINFRRNSGTDNKFRSKQLMASNLRLIIILMALVGICYYFFIHMDNLTPLIDKLTK